MSTKAIREALDILEDLVRTNVGHDVVKRAMAEVEAIEKACRFVNAHGMVMGFGTEARGDEGELDAAADFLLGIGGEDTP
jgi:hypothetical protein